MEPTENPCISRDSNNVPILVGTTTKILEIALDHIGYGWSAEEICEQHPYLTLGQVHCALAYYFEHKDEIDRDIERRRRLADELRPRLEDPVLAQRLRLAKQQRSQS